MIKTALLASVFAATLGAGMGFAQARTIYVWGHAYDAPDAEAPVVALAPERPMHHRALPAGTIRLRHHTSEQ